MSAKPDFLILGAKRGGTTSLFHYLMQHPAARAPANKELDYLYARTFDPSIYRSFFPGTGYSGEATPNYLIVETCARRIREINPQVKLIVLLREPVQRILSEYPKQLARGLVTESLLSLTRAEKKRLTDLSIETALCDLDYFHCHRRTSYLLRGLYYSALKMWHAVFPPESLLILTSEQLFENPRATLAEVLTFLGLDAWTDTPFPKLNSTKEWSPGSRSVLSLSPALLEELAEFFAPHNENLCRYLGTDFGWIAPTRFNGY